MFAYIHKFLWLYTYIQSEKQNLIYLKYALALHFSIYLSKMATPFQISESAKSSLLLVSFQTSSVPAKG